jgi:hypothetical protein
MKVLALLIQILVPCFAIYNNTNNTKIYAPLPHNLEQHVHGMIYGLSANPGSPNVCI